MKTENLEKIIKLRHELHEYPELSGNEKITKRRLMDFIENNTNLAVVDCGKWFYASHYVERTEATAFRAEMDALPIEEIEEFINIPYRSKNPGISHKCGHDGHCAALCGLALELNEIKKDHSVYLIFQHSEENGKGGVECSSLLRERNITEIFAFHNWSGWPEKNIVIREGLCQYASLGLTIKFTGKDSHASEPEKGLNPSRAISKFALSIEKISNELKNKNGISITIINIKVGEKNFGISPGEGEISFTIRAKESEEIRSVNSIIWEEAKKFASESGLNVNAEVSDFFPDTSSDLKCVKRIKNAAKKLNLEVINMPEAIRASEDFGHYTKIIPGAIFYIGNGIDYPAIHTPKYDFNDNILETAVDIFLELYKK